MVTTAKKSKFAGEGSKSVMKKNNANQDTWYNELLIHEENLERIADKIGGEIREAWLYGEWVKVAIRFTQTYRIGRGEPKHSTKTVFLGEYLEENQRTGFIHVLRESLDKEPN